MGKMAAGGESDLGIYLSVPFCRAKCSFCNFASGVGTPGAVARYVAQLIEEIHEARAYAARLGADLPSAVSSVYLGGGTPSLLEPEQLAAIFAALRGEFDLGRDAEITLEAAPGQIADELLETVLALGVNRVSLGVQSLVDREAQAVGRSHTRASCLGELRRLRERGVADLGADLIAGLPYQDAASWDASLEAAGEAGLDHLSVYMLEVDEDSRLGREVLNGGARLHAPAVASDDLIATMYERACERLPTMGFAQYEISNFGRSAGDGQARRSRHNLRYWTRAPYLGLGLDAHSMLEGEEAGSAVRWANPETLEEYAGTATRRAASWLSNRDRFEETVFLGLRLVEGMAWEAVERFEGQWVRELQESVAMLCREGLAGRNAERFWLTPRGRLVSGEIFGELLAGVAA